jgi:hypothetical protein
MMKLRYDSEDFPIAARKAIANGDVFTFEVRGPAWEKLRSHVVNDAVPSWAPLSAIPELRSFVVVMALAGVSDRRVRVNSFDDFAEVHVGSMH